MDFSFNEEQEAVRDLAAQIFTGHATVERVKEVEATAERFDRELWAELARANLLGLSLPEGSGGSGLGLVELCAVLEQQGRSVAPVPLLPTVASAMAIAEHGSEGQRRKWLPRVVAGEAVLTAALEKAPGDSLAVDGEGLLRGRYTAVPALPVAAAVLVPADDGAVHLVELAGPGVSVVPAETTNRELHGHLVCDGAPAERMGGPDVAGWLTERWATGLCALQLGVCEAALALAATYTSQRRQFGKPLSTFQGVALKAADAYIDTEALRATTWQAAWRLAEGLRASNEVLVAKWWAAEGGQRVVHITQHLHGGMGADVDYPVHRYFLWGKQIETSLGGAGQTLARLGRALAEVSP